MAYIPPGRRRQQIQSTNQQAPDALRSLDQLADAAVLVVQATFSSQQTETVQIQSVEHIGTTTTDTGEQQYQLQMSSLREMPGLIQWFKRLAQPGDRIDLSDDLSKADRKHVHGLAQKNGLDSSSQGYGEGRHISLLCGHAGEGKTSEHSMYTQVGRTEKKRINKMFKLAQEQSQDLLVSKNEIAEMMLAGCPNDVFTQLETTLETADLLAAATRAGDLEKVAASLDEDSSRMCTRFGFREESIHLLHLAVGFGRDNVVLELLQRGAKPNERDISNRTVLQVCEDYAPSNPEQNERKEAILSALLDHGADPELPRCTAEPLVITSTSRGSGRYRSNSSNRGKGGGGKGNPTISRGLSRGPSGDVSGGGNGWDRAGHGKGQTSREAPRAPGRGRW